MLCLRCWGGMFTCGVWFCAYVVCVQVDVVVTLCFRLVEIVILVRVVF